MEGGRNDPGGGEICQLPDCDRVRHRCGWNNNVERVTLRTD